MDTPGNKPPEQPKVNRALPKNPFVGLEAMPVSEKTIFLKTPEGAAVQYVDEKIREQLRDPVRKERDFGRALAYPPSYRILNSFLNNLENHYIWLFALDERFAPFHLMRLVCSGTRDEALNDGWAKFLSMINYAQLAVDQSKIPFAGLPVSSEMVVSPPTIMPGQDVRMRVAELIARGELPAEQSSSFEQSLRTEQQKPLNPVQRNGALVQLLCTKKIDIVEQFPHPVLPQIWSHPEFQDLYCRMNGVFQSLLRVLTQERLKMKTPERVFEASFVLPGAVAGHVGLMIDLAKHLAPVFMTSPSDVPGLSEGQKMIVLVTSDQQLQSPAELTEKIRTLAQQHGVSLGDIDCRWNQEKEATS